MCSIGVFEPVRVAPRDGRGGVARDAQPLEVKNVVFGGFTPHHGRDLLLRRQKGWAGGGAAADVRDSVLSKFHGAFVLNCRVDLHAIDATPAR